MKSLYELYTALPREQWYYYEGHSKNEFSNPFDEPMDFRQFIKDYFYKAGKREVLNESQIDLKKLRYPGHICSVHFLGILIYNNTKLKDKFHLGKSGVGYEFFPFLWFLITLYHDHFYALERSEDPQLKSLSGIYERYSIREKLLDCKDSNLERLGNIRSKYFAYRSTKDRVDHGIAAGIVLYDKLLTIRKIMQVSKPRKYYWDNNLIPKYKMAAEAISLHNIWLPQDDAARKDYVKEGLETLNDFKPVQLAEFPLFYLWVLWILSSL